MVLKTSKIVFINDGAVWIDNLRERNYPNSVSILDWYHATEHLWESGKKIYGENKKEKIESFVKPLESIMWEGDIEKLCTEITEQIKLHPQKEKELRELYNYYNTRKEKMRYKEYREKGYFIGSGSIESANKYLVKGRLKGSGMKWTILGAEAILKLREKWYEKTLGIFFSRKFLYFSY